MFDYEEKIGHYVLPQEAMRQLVIAIVLRALLDYRVTLFANLYKTSVGYDIQKTKAIADIERFFEEMGFDNYISIPSKIIAFQNELDKIALPICDGDLDHFRCPLCGGLVTVKQKRDTKKAACNGCFFKVTA